MSRPRLTALLFRSYYHPRQSSSCHLSSAQNYNLSKVYTIRKYTVHETRQQPTNHTTIYPARPIKPAPYAQEAASSSSSTNLIANAPAVVEDRSTIPQKAQKIPEKWRPYVKPTLSAYPGLYRELTKARLGGLVALTTMVAYAVAPGTPNLTTLLCTTVGTALCIGSANALNQWLEVPYDAQMARTRNRVLVRNALTPLHAFSFGVGTGISGVALLAATVNPITAILGGMNILLYAAVYTPMKRASIANTWVGALVGAIPPMMGWAASTGTVMEPGAWLLGATLYAWQFPHFNALAYNLRADYSKAGYRMMAVTDTVLNGRVSLRHCLALIPISFAAPAIHVTTAWFAFDSFFVNLAMAIPAYRFWRKPGEKNARQLFFVSLLHLPLVLALMMIHKAPPVVVDDDEEDGLRIREDSTLFDSQTQIRENKENDLVS